MSFEDVTYRYIRAADRMCLQGRVRIALDYLLEALRVDPDCYEALVAAGELYDVYSDELGMDEREGTLAGLAMFDRAVAVHPDLADAYAGKALGLLYIDQPIEAVRCADIGLQLLDADPTMHLPEAVRTNITESFYRIKALALQDMDRGDEGRQVLEEGLRRFPNSRYLSQIVHWFLPQSQDGERGERHGTDP
jgi:tetratricopeptide (TPR) repeat protein